MIVDTLVVEQRATSSMLMHSTGPSPDLGNAVAWTETAARTAPLGVHAVGLAAPLAAQLPVRLVDLHHVDVGCGKIPGQVGAVEAASFHPTPNQMSLRLEAGGHPPIRGARLLLGRCGG